MTPQVWDAADYAANARFVADLAQVVLDLLTDPSRRELLVAAPVSAQSP
jgi:hypothetical protein